HFSKIRRTFARPLSRSPSSRSLIAPSAGTGRTHAAPARLDNRARLRLCVGAHVLRFRGHRHTNRRRVFLMTNLRTIDRNRVATALAAERKRFTAEHPRSRALFEEAKASLLDGVPMNWMIRWAGDFPLFIKDGAGARFTDVDGREYIDFC